MKIFVHGDNTSGNDYDDDDESSIKKEKLSHSNYTVKLNLKPSIQISEIIVTSNLLNLLNTLN